MNKLFVPLFAALMMMMGTTAGSLAASLVAHIDISSQTMTVKKHGFVVGTWKVSTARKGYHTPRGTYRPTRMHTMWHSRKYDMSPMPYSIFFRGGYAIHGTGSVKALGRPASHGCVRLHPNNARELFSMVKQVGAKNTRIVITN